MRLPDLDLDDVPEASSAAHAAFQWGGSFALILLLILSFTGRRSYLQTSLVVFCLFTTFPSVLLKILRGQFGRWIAFFAVGVNLFSPLYSSVFGFLLFTITPNLLVKGLRNGIFASLTCLTVGAFIIIKQIHIGREGRHWCSILSYFIGIFLLFTFTILYICPGGW